MHGFAAELDDIESSCIVEQEASTSKRKLEQENSMDAPAPASARSNYAEYAQPELRTDLVKMVNCEECGAQLPDDVTALQTHRDHHFAQQLNQQLREEQREERQRSRLNATLNTTVSVPSPTAKPAPLKKAKKATGTVATTSAKPINTIAKFLAAKQPLEPPPSCSSSPLELCPECKTYVKSVDMPEHLDFHMARKLQRELNQLEVRTISTANIKKTSPPPRAKGQLNSTLNSATGNKSITQFFTQSN
ncbi:GH17989 [Drosophila grimshawi]|uniref:GH17989 n=1 Tax=Drosophila grimshawi TaxID=7222 RepID=B4K3Y4_DROGR|nr:GH17989 [Drosophila grimshawi]